MYSSSYYYHFTNGKSMADILLNVFQIRHVFGDVLTIFLVLKE